MSNQSVKSSSLTPEQLRELFRVELAARDLKDTFQNRSRLVGEIMTAPLGTLSPAMQQASFFMFPRG